jgi:hypothetical protein
MGQSRMDIAEGLGCPVCAGTRLRLGDELVCESCGSAVAGWVASENRLVWDRTLDPELARRAGSEAERWDRWAGTDRPRNAARGGSSARR